MVKNLLFIFLLFIISCSNKKQKDNSLELKEEIMNADRAFSTLSKEKGLKSAYLEYIDSNGVLLRPNSLPLTAGNAIDFICRNDDTSIEMSWSPKSGAVAASGDIGYTYGLYSIKPKYKDTVYYGTYVSIWKKQPDGKWKFMLDSGNEGIDK